MDNKIFYIDIFVFSLFRCKMNVICMIIPFDNSGSKVYAWCRDQMSPYIVARHNKDFAAVIKWLLIKLSPK